MSDTQTPGAASAPGTQTPDPISKAASFLDKALAVAAKPAALPVQEGQPAQQPNLPAQEGKPDEKPTSSPPLKDAIAEMRAKREAAQREAQRQAQYEQENTRLKQEMAALKAASDFESDPVAYAKARGWDRETQLMMGKALIYDLAPNEADPSFRVQMFEAKQKREAKAKAVAEEKQRTEAEQQAARQELMNFAQSIETGVMSFEAGSYPESEAWYGDNVEGYLRDMFDTAMKMAKDATQAGTQADLSPQAIAAKLEADTAARLAARDKRRSQRATPAQPVGQQQVAAPQQGRQDAEQSVIDTTSSKNMSGGAGAPLPPAKTEAERAQRAAAVLFGTR